jgi:hypothetical protein
MVERSIDGSEIYIYSGTPEHGLLYHNITDRISLSARSNDGLFITGSHLFMRIIAMPGF